MITKYNYFKPIIRTNNIFKSLQKSLQQRFILNITFNFKDPFLLKNQLIHHLVDGILIIV